MPWSMRRRVPRYAYFVGSAVFHYLGPAFAVLLFARVDVARGGVAADRDRGASCTRSGAALARAARRSLARRSLLAVGRGVSAVDELLLLPGDRPAAARDGRRDRVPARWSRSPRWACARRATRRLSALAVGGVVPADARCGSRGEPLGLAFAFANAALFAALHRARRTASSRSRRSAASTGSRRRCWSRSSS